MSDWYFVLIFLLVTSEGKNLTSDFPVFPSYQGRKKGTEETISRLRQRRSLEMFPRFPFLYRGNLGKQENQRSIFPEDLSRKKIRTECFFQFSHYFCKVFYKKFLVIVPTTLQFPKTKLSELISNN